MIRQLINYNLISAIIITSLVLCTPRLLIAEVFSSDNFKILTPIITPGGYTTSSSYLLQGSFEPLGVGSSASAGYKLFTGFEYFPFITTPVLAASGGSGSVTLTWTAADAGVGYNVGGYSVGHSSSSGGPYIFSSVGNALTSSITSLTPGTTYHFVVRVHDGLGNVIATSTEVNAIPTAPPTPPPSGGGGGGGGGGGASAPTLPPIGTGSATALFSGRAYPRSVITILKDAQVVSTTVADAQANFSVSVTNLSAGNYFFSVYSEDNVGNRSSLLTFPVSVTSGATTNIGGIFITPTIGVDKSEVRRGDTVVIFGQTVAQSEVTIQVNSDEPHFAKTTSDASGAYLYNFDSTPLEYGDHTTKSKSAIKGEISSFSTAASFKVGTQNIFRSQTTKPASKKGDANNDGRVNLVDYSVVAYWYKRPNPPKVADLNGDGKVDLIDFSILAYNWTG